MNIGKESEPYVIEPIHDPVPGRKSTPAPEPDTLPAPEREPEREKVPA